MKQVLKNEASFLKDNFALTYTPPTTKQPVPSQTPTAMSPKVLFISFSILILFAVSAVVLSEYLKKSYNANMQNRIMAVNARCGYASCGFPAQKLLNIYYVDGSNFRNVLQLLPSIREPFNIGISKTVLEQNDIDFLIRAHNLAGISFVDCKFSPDRSIVEKLSNCRKLKMLGIACRNHDENIPFKEISCLQQISALEIITRKIPEADLEFIPNLQLLALDIMLSTLSDNHISTILKCSSLQRLTLHRCSFIDSEYQQIHKIRRFRTIHNSRYEVCHVSSK
jgi:hypothetical protein